MRVETQKPGWLTSSKPAKLAADNRARCPQCRGRKSDAGRLLDKDIDRRNGAILYIGCRQCTEQGATGPCQLHRCKVCDGTGLVCPECLGFRFLHADVDPGHPAFGKLTRCATCCPSNIMDPTAERRAIERYAETYRRAHEPTQLPIADGDE